MHTKTAIAGAFALAFFADPAAGERSQVVLLDLNLPKIDGLEVLRRIRGGEGTPRVPVVALTSSKENQDVVQSYPGADSYVLKPGPVREAARQPGFYWLVLNEPPLN